MSVVKKKVEGEGCCPVNNRCKNEPRLPAKQVTKTAFAKMDRAAKRNNVTQLNSVAVILQKTEKPILGPDRSRKNPGWRERTGGDVPLYEGARG